MDAEIANLSLDDAAVYRDSETPQHEAAAAVEAAAAAFDDDGVENLSNWLSRVVREATTEQQQLDAIASCLFVANAMCDWPDSDAHRPKEKLGFDIFCKMPPVKKLLAAERARRRTGVQHAHGREEESNECDGEWLSFRLLSANVSSAELCCSAAMALNFTLWSAPLCSPPYALSPPCPPPCAPLYGSRHLLSVRRQQQHARPQHTLEQLQRAHKLPTKARQSRCAARLQGTAACQQMGPGRSPAHIAGHVPCWTQAARALATQEIVDLSILPPVSSPTLICPTQRSRLYMRVSPDAAASVNILCQIPCKPATLFSISAIRHPACQPPSLSAWKYYLAEPLPLCHRSWRTSPAAIVSEPQPPSPSAAQSGAAQPGPWSSSPRSSPGDTASQPRHCHLHPLVLIHIGYEKLSPSRRPPAALATASDHPAPAPAATPPAGPAVVASGPSAGQRVRGEGVVGAETTREGQSNENAHGSANEGRRRLPEADLNTLLQELGVGRMSGLHHIFDGNGWTLIHSAARQGNTPVLEALVGVGMSIGELGKDTLTTAMHLAALGGHVESMQLLRSHGADIRARTTKCSCIASNNPALPFIVVPTASLHSLPCFLAYCLSPLSSLLPRLLSLSTLLPASSPTVSLHSPPCFLAYCLSPLSSLLPRLLSLSTLLPASSPTVSLHSSPCFLAYCLPPLSSLLPRLLSPSTLLPASSPSGTPLHHAAKEQQWDAVRWLAQQGIKPEEVERPGANPKADKLPAHLMAQAVQIVREVYELEVLLTECIVENGNSMGGHATAAGS
ncbi:unnamed protein product [Closterium sp. NIES-64]|nr:unnamed protein product [Closterium sp. NIES-64]